MFDKTILQIGKYSLPNYVTNYSLNNLQSANDDNGWKYNFFKTDFLDKWKNFIVTNPHKKFKKSAEIYNSLNTYDLKYYYFIFYYLYTHGGFYINECVVLEPNISNFDFSKELVVVESCINRNELFNGFIFCHKKNKLIELFLKKIETKFNAGDFNNPQNLIIFFKEEFKNDIKSAISLQSNLSTLQKYFIFNETITNSMSTIYDPNNPDVIYAKHYFNPINNFFKLPEYPTHLPKQSTENTKIGVTFNLVDSVNDMFVNGINQNSLYLTELLINAGYDVCIIIDDSKLNDKNVTTLQEISYDPRFKYSNFTDILVLELDVLIQLSFSFWQDVKVVKMMKYIGTKLVGYFCGNSYIINSEKILYNQHKTRDNTKDCFNFIFPDGTNILDEIWSIPQMVNTNLHYWKTLYRCNCIEAPFVWSTKSFYFTKKYFKYETENELMYVNRGPEKKIGIFEPNISIMKWALPCLLICENTYRINKKINHIYITNMSVDKDASGNSVSKKIINDFNLPTFNHILCSLDIFNDKKCSVESRYNTLQFMKSFCDVAVSHQWENPLNYLYFDLAWMGWPIVHNAHLCADLGYYYEGFNYEEGGDKLNEVLENHDTSIEEYIHRNRQAIDKYLPTNIELQNKYKLMIENIINPI